METVRDKYNKLNQIVDEKFVFENEKYIQNIYTQVQQLLIEASLDNDKEIISKSRSLLAFISFALWYSKISIGSLSQFNLNGEIYVSSEAILRKFGSVKTGFYLRKSRTELLEKMLNYKSIQILPEPPSKKVVYLFPLTVINKFMEENKKGIGNFNFDDHFYVSSFIRSEFGRISTKVLENIGCFNSFSDLKLVLNEKQMIVFCCYILFVRVIKQRKNSPLDLNIEFDGVNIKNYSLQRFLKKINTLSLEDLKNLLNDLVYPETNYIEKLREKQRNYLTLQSKLRK